MIVTINNDEIIAENPTDSLVNLVTSELVYKDKAKQYQLRRMARNPWSRNSPLYKQLQQEVDGKLYKTDGNKLIFSSCFYSYIQSELVGHQITDNRKETGTKIVVPWVKKPHNLRPYQKEAVDLMLSNYRGVINFATGLGKTLVATHLVQQYKK